MNILHIATSFAYVHKALVEYEIKSGAACQVFQYNLRRKKPINFPNYVESYNPPFHSRGHFLFQIRMRNIIQNAFKLYGGGEYDIVHAHYLHADGQIAYEMAQKNQIPYVVTVRNSDLYTPALWLFPWNRVQMLRTLEHAGAVIFLGPSHKKELLVRLPEELKKKVEEKSVIIPNGMDDFWHQNIWTGRCTEIFEKTIITVGDIEHNKNQAAVMRAVKFLQKEGSPYRYVVVGRILDKRIVSKLIKNGAEVFTYQEKEKLLELYRKSSIFVLPSFKETFGLVYPEAMSQGLPVVYTKGQGFDGQFEDGVVGIAVDAGCPSEIAAAIKNIEKDYQRYSINARIKSSVFSWDYVAKKMLGVYCEVMNESIPTEK